MSSDTKRAEQLLNECIGVMVACQGCNTVVWANDTGTYNLWCGISGLFNMMGMPCRLCGTRGNYDGYNVTGSHRDRFHAYDGWSTMRALAQYERWTWDIAGDNSWRTNEEIDAAFGRAPKEEVAKS